jgi:hypothetical protein
VLRRCAPALAGIPLVLGVGVLAAPAAAAAATAAAPPTTTPTTTTGATQADLAVEGPVLAGENILIGILNHGPSKTQIPVKLTVDITGQVTLQLPSGCARSGQRVTCTTGIPAGRSSAQVVLKVTANTGQVGMTATVSAPPGVDPNPANNSSSGNSPWFTTSTSSSPSTSPTTSQPTTTSRSSASTPSQTPASSSAGADPSSTDPTDFSSESAAASATDSPSPDGGTPTDAATDGAAAPLHAVPVAHDGAMPFLTAGVAFVLLLMAGLALMLRHRNRVEARNAGGPADDAQAK